MSSGGQNGTTLTGPQGIRIRDASDVIAQTRLKLTYMTNNSSNSGYTGSNAYRSKGVQNSCDFLLQVQKGLRECGVSSNGSTFISVQGPIASFTTGVVTTAAGGTAGIASTTPLTNQFP
jgi:hypothetical protein